MCPYQRAWLARVWSVVLRLAIASVVQVADKKTETGIANLGGVREGAREAEIMATAILIYVTRIPGLFQHSRVACSTVQFGYRIHVTTVLHFFVWSQRSEDGSRYGVEWVGWSKPSTGRRPLHVLAVDLTPYILSLYIYC